VVRVKEFAGSALGKGELSSIERLIVSYVVELKVFRVIDSVGQDLALAESETALQAGNTATVSPLSADFILTGTVGKIGDFFVLSLENVKVSSGEKVSVSDTAMSVNDLVLKARALTRSLFGKQDTGAAFQDDVKPPVATPPVTTPPIVQPKQSPPVAVALPTLKVLAGTWKGDKGIDSARIFPDGNGLAFITGGGSFKIKLEIAGSDVVIGQNQPNISRMFQGSGLPPELVRKLVAEARPMKWVMRLSVDGQRLMGRKESVWVSSDTKGVTIDNNYEREATWTKLTE